MLDSNLHCSSSNPFSLLGREGTQLFAHLIVCALFFFGGKNALRFHSLGARKDNLHLLIRSKES
jgi:hypothetical protein